MKKNKMMRLASSLLVAVLLTSSVISGTFAKYVTSDSAEDTARVAKWGVTVLVSGNLFGTDYNEKNALDNGDSIVAKSSDNVSSSNSQNVVAPGTKNEVGATLRVKGTPEVAYSVDAEADADIEDIFLKAGKYGVMVEATGLNKATDVSTYYVLNTNEYTLATTPWDPSTVYYELHDVVEIAEDYYPIKWTAVGANLANIVGRNLKTVAGQMATNMSALSGDANKNAYAEYTLKWEWAFEGQNDGADTILGNLAGTFVDGSKVVKFETDKYTNVLTDGTDYNLDIVFGFEVTVTQVD